MVITQVLERPFTIKHGAAILNWELDKINSKSKNQNLLVHKIGHSKNISKSKIEQN